jgi:hypothetical protein
VLNGRHYICVISPNDKKNDTVVTAAKVFSLVTTIIFAVAIVGLTTIPPLTALDCRGQYEEEKKDS